ncbi:hypothetical protein MBLNU13_g00374t1 [Cladosporium sp. NU13]
MTQKTRKVNLAVLGSGFMGTSILKGLLRDAQESEDGIKLSYTACVRSDASLNRLRNALGDCAKEVHCQISGFTEAADKAEIVMLGVPPGELDNLFKTPGLAEVVQGKLIHSTGGKQEGFESDVARVIPTIAAQVNDSVTLVAESNALRQEQQQLCTALFKRIGAVQPIPEDLMNEATATGAVCHAIAICAVDAAVDASVAKGLPRAAALSLAANSLRSAAGLLGGEMTPEELKAAMSVPSGITINSVLKLDRANMRFAVADAVGEAIDYTRSMA